MPKLPASLWRASATLIIIARNGLLQSKKMGRFDYRVLMLQRSAKTRFMPGNYVFPGGMIDNADYDNNWMDLYQKSFQMFGSDFTSLMDIKDPRPMIFSKSSTLIPSEIALRICAIREVFEESGVLLLKKIKSTTSKQSSLTRGCVSVDNELTKQEINKWRTDVHNNASKFIELCRLLGSVPDIWSLSEWSNWLTPLYLKIRFNTAFFMCFCESEPAAQHDEKETIHSEWLTPIQAANDHYAKKYTLAPPQLYTITQLLSKPKWDELKMFQENRAKQGIIPMLPIGFKCKDATCGIFPGDDMYETLLAHTEEIVSRENWKKDGFLIPRKEFNETYEELEKGTVTFHRAIFELGTKMMRFKTNCDREGGPLYPSDRLEDYFTGNGKSKL